jgi:hypothetical protein
MAIESEVNDEQQEEQSEVVDSNAELETLRSKLAAQSAELERSKAAMAETNAERARRETEAKRLHEAGLMEGKKYKTLFETRDKELQDLRNKQSEQSQSIAKTFKLQAKREQALKAGIREEALQDLEYFPDDELELRRSESGVLDVTGADRWIENLKTSKPYLFKSSSAPNLQGGRPSPLTKQTKKVNMLQLERDDPEAYEAEMSRMIKDRGIQIK